MRILVRRWGLVLVVVSLLGVRPAAAQVSKGEIFGRVSDSTGAVLPGVSVRIDSPALIQPQAVTTAENGGYRFPNVPIGTYTVTFELPGFKRVVHEGIVITAGFNAEVNARLDISTVQETVTVSGESPVVDTKSTQVGGNFNLKQLQDIPTARDPWEIIQQTPGMVMTSENVGGNGSGQQPGFSAHGTSTQVWTMDGATITDTSSNSSPMYYDFDSFAEMQINTGAGDASQQSSGITVNIVTKSGSNQFRGGGRYYVTDQKLESDNITDALRAAKAGAGNPIKNIQDYGIEFGGPIVRNKAWFYGSEGRNDLKVGVVGFLIDPKGDPNDRNNLRTDKTLLDNQNAKLNYQWTASHKTTFGYARDNKTRNARGADVNHPIETTYRQSGPTAVSRLEHQWVVSNRMSIDGQVTHVSGGFLLDFQEPGLKDVQELFYVDRGDHHRTAAGGNYRTIRPQWEERIDGNYYLPKFAGGDHAMKFGFRYRTTPIESISIIGGGAIARIRTNSAGVETRKEVDIVRDADFNTKRWDNNVYFNDTYKVKRTTVNAGLRLDNYRDKALPAHAPANRLLPNLLPDLQFQGADSGVRWHNVQPRLGVNYDMRGNGKTVLRGNFARYFGITMNTAGTLEPTGSPTTLRYGWNDANGDLVVQANEINLAGGLLNTPANYDPANPSSPVTPNTVDPNLENSRTTEYTAGFDHELMQDFAVGVTYIHRKYDQSSGLFRVGATSDSYFPVTYTDTCGNTTCSQPSYTVTYYQRNSSLPAAQIRRNSGSYSTFNGVELTARKRYSNHWMLAANLAINRGTQHAPEATRDYLDPTNHDLTEGKSSGVTPWTSKISALYALPWGVSVSGIADLRSGFTHNTTITTPTRPNGLGTASVLLQDANSLTYPSFHQFDIRVDKAIRFGARSVTFAATVFNITNNNVVLAIQTRQNTSTANNVTRILAPRVAQVGVKVNF